MPGSSRKPFGRENQGGENRQGDGGLLHPPYGTLPAVPSHQEQLQPGNPCRQDEFRGEAGGRRCSTNWRRHAGTDTHL